MKLEHLREISIAGCPCIGKGKNGGVYRLDEETIVKLYPADSAGWQAVEQERPWPWGCRPPVSMI